MNAIQEILTVSNRINNGRDLDSVFAHLEGEVTELMSEIDKAYYGDEPGEDGILGEAVDVALCALDAAIIANPGITEAQINEVVSRKLAKWERIYGGKHNDTAQV